MLLIVGLGSFHMDEVKTSPQDLDFLICDASGSRVSSGTGLLRRFRREFIEQPEYGEPTCGKLLIECL